MRDFITKTFWNFLAGTLFITLIVGIAWLFDSKPNNLYFVWHVGLKTTTVSFLFFILFGGNKN